MRIIYLRISDMNIPKLPLLLAVAVVFTKRMNSQPRSQRNVALVVGCWTLTKKRKPIWAEALALM